ACQRDAAYCRVSVIEFWVELTVYWVPALMVNCDLCRAIGPRRSRMPWLIRRPRHTNHDWPRRRSGHPERRNVASAVYLAHWRSLFALPNEVETNGRLPTYLAPAHRAGISPHGYLSRRVVRPDGHSSEPGLV